MFWRFLAAILDFILLLLCLSVCFFILDHNHVAMGTFCSISVSLVIWTKSEWIKKLNSVRNYRNLSKWRLFSFIYLFYYFKKKYVQLVMIKHWLPELSPFIYIVGPIRKSNIISSIVHSLLLSYLKSEERTSSHVEDLPGGAKCSLKVYGGDIVHGNHPEKVQINPWSC